MADTPAERTPEERAALYRRIPAYALLRATITHDHDAAVLIVSENTRPDLLVFEVAAIAARVLLASEGYDLAKVLRTLDFWIETAANGVPSAAEAARQHGTRRERARRGPARGPGRGGPGRYRAHPCLHGAGPLHGGRASWPAGPPGDSGLRFAAIVASSAAVILTREAAGDRDGALRAADAALEVYQGIAVQAHQARPAQGQAA